MIQDSTIVTCPTCPWCHQESIVQMPTAAFEKWQGGELIQRAWPQGSAGEREQLITGYHDKCWDEAIPADDEDEEEQA